MKIAILSGKGGTGKTFVSVNLARIIPESHYIDCDCEEPNGHLFLKPENEVIEAVSVKLPLINHEQCNACRKCVNICRFNALAYINNQVKVFREVCHSCGACVMLCPQKAITETDKTIGTIHSGISLNMSISSGFLNIGEASSVPIIKKLLTKIKHDTDTIIDCPPGSACSVMESIQEADFCLLVAESSIFGAHNLNMVLDLVQLMGKKHAVILNKSNNEENPSEILCHQRAINIIASIPYDNTIAQLNSEGQIIVDHNIKYKEIFENIAQKIREELDQ